jgi:hypothetical protein
MPVVMNLMSSCGVQNYYRVKDLDAQILSEKKKSLTVIKKWHLERKRIGSLRDSIGYYRRLNVPQN